MTGQAREIYNISNPQSLDDITRQLNSILIRITDRLDRIEGLRGTPTNYSGSTNYPGGTTSGQAVTVRDSGGVKIHELG
jgi:hypothetical protein